MNSKLLTVSSGLFLISVLTACETISSTQETPLVGTAVNDENFELAVAAFSEENLGIREASRGAVAVGRDGCEIFDDLRDQFDALLPINSGERRDSERRHAPYGLPIIEDDNGLEFLLHHNEFILGYNTDLKVPMYALYRLDSADVVSGNRKDCFREDHRLDEADRSTLADYDEPVFDRGHLVPVGDMHREFSTSVNTFFMSNMMPQSASFNRGVWQFLERSTRAWAKARGSIYVISGPVYDRDDDMQRDAEADAKRIEFERNVGEPTHFFRIILHERSDGFIESMSFLLPHTFSSVAPNALYVKGKFVTIDEIESRTGYDFLAGISDRKEDAIEGFKASELWGVSN